MDESERRRTDCMWPLEIWWTKENVCHPITHINLTSIALYLGGRIIYWLLAGGEWSSSVTGHQKDKGTVWAGWLDYICHVKFSWHLYLQYSYFRIEHLLCYIEAGLNAQTFLLREALWASGRKEEPFIESVGLSDRLRFGREGTKECVNWMKHARGQSRLEGHVNRISA